MSVCRSPALGHTCSWKQSGDSLGFFSCPWRKTVFGSVVSTSFVPVLQMSSINFHVAFIWKKHWFIGLSAFLGIKSGMKKTDMRELVCAHPCRMSGVWLQARVNSHMDWNHQCQHSQMHQAGNKISAAVRLSGQNSSDDVSVNMVYGQGSVSLL